MRVVRIYTKASGESALEVREVPMSGKERPASGTFQGGALFFRETPEDFDISRWPLAERLDP